MGSAGCTMTMAFHNYITRTCVPGCGLVLNAGVEVVEVLRAGAEEAVTTGCLLPSGLLPLTVDLSLLYVLAPSSHGSHEM